MRRNAIPTGRQAVREFLPDGGMIVVHLPADHGTTLDLRARVLRVEKGPRAVLYGAELVDVDDRTRERLYRLVLRLQREEVRRQSSARD